MKINDNIFRAYDIRGIYPTEINEEVTYKIGLAYGSCLRKIGEKSCIVGYDNRLSSPKLFASLTRGILNSGINITNLGLVTTPIVYFAREHLNIPASIMITASHNPGDNNGFKFSFDRSGNVKGDDIIKFREFIKNDTFVIGNGKMINKDIKEEYIEELLRGIKLGDKKLKIVFDLGNGATTVIAKSLFSKLDIEGIYICEENDGTFPIHHPDPSIEDNMHLLKETVLNNNADIGIGFDGDGDRLGIIDNLGNFIPADIFSALYAKDILNNKLNNKILGDIKCSDALKEIVLASDGNYTECRTGASYMMSYMKEDNYVLGIEYSGHIYFNDVFMPITSALYAALRMIEILSNNKHSLSELIEDLPKYYKCPEIRLEVGDDNKQQIVNKINDYAAINNLHTSLIDGVKVIYPDAWALVRCSNTGPNITIIFEAKKEDRLLSLKKEYLDLINLYIK